MKATRARKRTTASLRHVCRGQATVLLAVCGAVLAWRLTLVYGLDAVPSVATGPSAGFYPRVLHATDTRLDSILFGCVLALYGNPVCDKTRFLPRTWLAVWLPVGLALCLATFLYRDTRFRETFRYTLQGLGMFPIFIAAIRYSDRGLFKLLNLKVIRLVGAWSYTLYLCHGLILEAVMEWLPTLAPAAQATLAAALSLAFSALLHVAVEKPLAQLRKRLTSTVVRSTVVAPG